MHDFDPRKGTPTNMSKGSFTSGKVGRHGHSARGAGKQMGAPLHTGYPFNGNVSNTSGTGGRFAGASRAKLTKGTRGRS